MNWMRRKLWGGNSSTLTDADSNASGHSKRDKTKTPLREYSSSPNIVCYVTENCRPSPVRGNRIGEKLNNYNGRSFLDLSSPLSAIDEVDVKEADGEKADTIEQSEELEDADAGETVPKLRDNSSTSSIAEDPSESIAEVRVKDESIHVGNTEPTSLVKQCFSSQLKGLSLDSLTGVGLHEAPSERESSLGYGTNESGAGGRGGDNLDGDSQSFRGSQPDWRNIFHSRSRSNLLSTKDDNPPHEELSPTSPEPPVTNQINIYGSHTSIQTNFETNMGTGDSRLSRCGSRPQMITVNGSYRQNSIAERTESLLQSFESEKSRVLTTATKKAIEKLTSEKGDHVVVVVGHKFDGKKYIARSTLARLTDWQVAFINTPEEMDEIESSDVKKTCFCIVDIFGKAEFKTANLEKWEYRFDEMISKAKAWKTGLIITMNKGVFEKYTMKHHRHDLFKEENLLDLTNNDRLSEDDKMGILKCQLQLFPDASRVVFTQDRENDNADQFQSEGELCIWDGYLEEIVDVPCAYGYPKQAEMYSSKLEYIQMRSEFFKRPLKFHCLTVAHIRQSKDIGDSESTFAIETTFALKGRINMKGLEDRYAKSMKSNKGRFNQSVKYTRGKEQDGHAILDQLIRGMKSPEDAVTMFNKGAMNVDHWLLIQENDDTVKFSSPAGHHATALVMSKQFEADVIRCAPRDFIKFCVRPYDEKDRNEELLFVHKSPKRSTVKDEIYRRLVTDAIENGKVSDVCSHPLMTRRWFSTGFLGFLESTRCISEFITKLDAKTGMCALVHGMSKQYADAPAKEPQNLTEELLHSAIWRNNCKGEHLKRKQEKESLYQACRQGLYTTFVRLRRNLDPACLRLAVEAGCAEIAEDILREKRFIKFSELSDMMTIACRTHCKSNPAVGLKIAMLFKDKDCSIDRKDGKNDPLIHEAVRDNNVQLLKIIHDLDCDLDIKDKKGNRPLHNCVLSDSMECADALLTYKADPTKSNNQHLTPLHLAVTHGSLRLVRTLARHTESLNEYDPHKRTALHLAVQKKRSINMLECLIGLGADVTKKDRDGHGPLYYAIVSKNLQAVKLLTATGASVSDTDRQQRTMFEVAVAQNSKQIVECLIEASLNLPGHENIIPFVLIDLGDRALFEKAIQRGRGLSCRNKNGDTLLKYAIERNRMDFVSLLCESDSTLISLECKGMLPLHTAISSTNSSFEICNYLIASGASTSRKTSTGDTPLHLSCQFARLDVVQLLLELDIGLLHARNNNGMTALHIAAETGHLTIVQILLIMEADPQAQSYQPPLIPLDIALVKRNFYNEQCGRNNIEKVRTYDQIMAELRKRMYGKRRYASTMELRPLK